MKLNRWILTAVILWICGNAQAAFINGVEDFVGTSVDDSTWVQSAPGGNGAATVSNGYLDLTGQYWLGTRHVTLGVGDTLSARVMLTENSNYGTLVDLGFTTTPESPSVGQHVELTLLHAIQGDSYFIAGGGYGNRTFGLGHVEMEYNVGAWYHISLHRDTLSSYSAELSTDSGLTRYGLNFDFEGLPSQMSVFIGLGPTARFDWVAIPELPATCLVWGGFLLLWSCGRRKRP